MTGNASTLAWAALGLWPVFCIFVYQRTSLPVALCVTIVGGYLLLPSAVSWDLPVVPSLDKRSIPTLTALVLTAIAVNRADQPAFVLPGWLPRSLLMKGLLVTLFLGVIGTIQTNQDPLFYGPRFITGMQFYDGLSVTQRLIILLLPFLLARKVLAGPEGHRILLLAFAVSALIYTIPTLYEVRMSPQLHRMFYGFFPHSFLQAIRQGGFRPSVFLDHGLSLGIYLTYALIAAAGLYRASKMTGRGKWLAAVAWLFLVLVLAKSLGPLMIACLLVPVVLFFSARVQLMVATCIAVIVMSYPMLRAVDVVPIQRFAAFASSIDPIRAESFVFRVRHEDKLLEKARERPTFGWGEWGRNRIYDELGRDLSVTDGAWIIHWSVGGWFRYIPLFGLMCWPIIGLFFSRGKAVDPLCAALSLVLAAQLINIIPNTGLLAINWMMAGALLGRLEMRAKAGALAPDPETAPPEGAGAPAPTRAPQYARRFPGKEKPSVVPEPAQTTGRPRTPYSRSLPTTGHRR